MPTRSPGVVVGFDFSFSLPEWFLHQRGYAERARALGRRPRPTAKRGCATASPRSGVDRGDRRPDLPEHLRRTEAELAAVGGIRPKSSFQIGGAGSVGTGSVRGFPALARLQDAGFAIWPFDAPARPPVAVEIWPRALTGPVVKSDATARAAYLDRAPPRPRPGVPRRRRRQRGRVRRRGVGASSCRATNRRCARCPPLDDRRALRGMCLEPGGSGSERRRDVSRLTARAAGGRPTARSPVAAWPRCRCRTSTSTRRRPCRPAPTRSRARWTRCVPSFSATSTVPWYATAWSPMRTSAHRARSTCRPTRAAWRRSRSLAAAA